MIWAGTGIAGLLGLWLGLAAFLARSRGISLRQALLYAPLKVAYSIKDDSLRGFPRDRGTIYVVSHRSRLDPALMLTLLPRNTLHILDHDAASSWWMEPFRELARTIAFKAEHVFVSRRLVRILRGNGGIAVYLPENPEPDTKAFRLYRAVARIALTAQASVVTIRIGRPGRTTSDRPIGDRVRSWPSRPITVTALAPASIEELRERIGAGSTTASNALFDRVAQARVAAADTSQTIFEAIASAAHRHGNDHVVVDTADGERLNYRDLMVSARLLSQHLVQTTEKGDTIGLFLPASIQMVQTFVATQSAGLVAAIFPHAAEPSDLALTVRAASMRFVLTSRAMSHDPALGQALAAIATAGARLLWIEDIAESATTFDAFYTGFMRYRPTRASRADDAAVILLSRSGEEPNKLIILSHRNLLSNVAQIAARIRLKGTDRLFAAYPPYEALGLSAGILLPLLAGARFRIDAEGLAGLAASQASIVFAPSAVLNASIGRAEDGFLPDLRAVICLGEPIMRETRAVLAARSIDLLGAHGVSEAGGIVALASTSQRRSGTAGRLLPGMRLKLEPVAGIERGGRMSIAGPNVMLGHMGVETPGRITAPEGGWFDTGHLASIDREGFLSILGQTGRSAHIQDASIPLEPCEAVAATLWPDADHVAVALPNRRKGERIVLVTTARDADRASMRRQARGLGLADIVLPMDILHVESLAHDAAGGRDIEAARRLAHTALARTKAA